MSAAVEPTIVRGAWVIAMAPGADVIRDGAVLFDREGAIEAVGAAEELLAGHPEAAVIGDGEGIVMPGMVNAHTHLTECLIPGMGEDAVLWEWFERVVNPAGCVISRDDVAIGTRLKAAEMLRSGVTTVNDMCCHRNLGSEASLGAVDGLADLGLRGVVSFGAEDAYVNASPAAVFMAEHEALADRLADEPLLGFRAGVGTVLGITEELFELTVAACREHGWAVHTHLAEVREEISEARTRWGVGTIEQAGRMGLLEFPIIAGHCIWCTEHDVGLLASNQVAVAHNPVANMILGSGVCRVPRLRAAGISVGLGTDGAASNDNQDMFGVLKSAALLQKVSNLDPAVISAADVIRMATVEGAEALGLEAEIGSLEPGKRADLVLLDGNTPELATIHDPFQQVVYCATSRCVSDVWIDGRRVLTEGDLTEVELGGLIEQARRAGAELVRRAGMGRESVYAGPGRLEQSQHG